MIEKYFQSYCCLISVEKCEKLVALARKHNVLVIADDIYNLLTYKGDNGSFSKSPPCLFTYDRKSDAGYAGGHVISNGTFSKIAAPGLRVGWMEAPRRVIDHINATGYIPISGGGMSYYVSRVFAGVLESGALDRHVNGLQHKHKVPLFLTSGSRYASQYGVLLHATKSRVM